MYGRCRGDVGDRVTDGIEDGASNEDCDDSRTIGIAADSVCPNGIVSEWRVNAV